MNLNSRKFKVSEKPKLNYKMPEPERMLTMQEAMDYLSIKGLPCRSRITFYRILDDFNVKYINTNPRGKHEVRRFALEDLDKVLKAKGLIARG